MSGRIILRPYVPGDIEQTLDYLAERISVAADRFADAIRKTLEDLAQMPGMGSPKRFDSRKLANIRSWAVEGFPKHLILYRPIEDGIEVLAIVHGARNLSAILKERT